MTDRRVQREVVVYGTRLCMYCHRARDLLSRKGIEYREYAVDADPDRRSEMERLSGRRSVPQIFIGGSPIGGYDALRNLDASGRLETLLYEDEGPRYA